MSAIFEWLFNLLYIFSLMLLQLFIVIVIFIGWILEKLGFR